MDTAILILTKTGLETGYRVAAGFNGNHRRHPIDLFVPRELEHLVQESEGVRIHIFADQFKVLMADVFVNYKNLICIMALGIVVRIIGPLAKGKDIDPAVVVIDEKGQFVISVLSGHLGGANRLTQDIAEVIGGQPVVTTATDIHGKIAVDRLAEQWDMSVEPLSMIKIFNKALLDDLPLSIYYHGKRPKDIPNDYLVSPLDGKLKDNQQPFGTIYITNKLLDVDEERAIFLRPKNLVVGVGCRRGCPVERVKDAISSSLENAQLSIKSVKALATVEIKKDEPALITIAKEMAIPINFFTVEEIEQYLAGSKDDNQLSYSDFVKQQIGVGGVCEPAALIVCPEAKLIVKKTKYQGVTVAIAQVD